MQEAEKAHMQMRELLVTAERNGEADAIANGYKTTESKRGPSRALNSFPSISFLELPKGF